jgi:hypothetical protein
MSFFAQVKLDTNNGAGDAFGRLRVSNPTTLFDSKQIHDDPDLASSVENQPLFYDNQEVSGTGTATLYEVNKAQTVLSVSASTAGRRIRQTKMRFNYQPGKSQLTLMTFSFSSAATAGILRKEGQFDEKNGLFLDDNGVTYGFVRRTYVTGSAVDNRVAQADWNVDPMDGTGPSGVNLDFTKTQILVMDYEWLGVGRIRMGFNVHGVTYIAHEFLNTNNLDVVYMSDPNLPLRSEIENTGAGAAASITQICSTVISEGGSEDLGSVRSASTNGTHVDANTENTIYAILGIKQKAAYLSNTIKLIDFSIQEQAGSKKMEWMLLLNPTVADTFTYADEPLSAVQIARGATANTVTDGYRLAGGFFESAGQAGGGAGSIGGILNNAIKLGSLIDGTLDAMVLCVRPVGGSSNTDVEASITWRELN